MRPFDAMGSVSVVRRNPSTHVIEEIHQEVDVHGSLLLTSRIRLRQNGKAPPSGARSRLEEYVLGSGLPLDLDGFNRHIDLLRASRPDAHIFRRGWMLTRSACRAPWVPLREIRGGCLFEFLGPHQALVYPLCRQMLTACDLDPSTINPTKPIKCRIPRASCDSAIGCPHAAALFSCTHHDEY